MYDTQLSPAEELLFNQWFSKQKQIGNIPENDIGNDYDYRGAFKNGINGEFIPSHGEVHWLDTYKKPNHPSFSTESIYATGDNAKYAGQWLNPNTLQEKYIPPTVQYPQTNLLNILQLLKYS